MKTNIPPLQPETWYHIFNRGINGENLFKEIRNYAYFLNKYDQYVSPIADTYAYCLLKNHFHILVRTKSEKEIADFKKKASPEAKSSLESDSPKIISNAFASLFKSYAQAINKAHNRTGALFEEPFRRKEVSSDGYVSQLIHYIHFNPQNHGFVSDFREYPYSSYSAFISDKPTFLQREEVLKWFGNEKKFTEFHNASPSVNDIKDMLF